jgi:hypothetical protein
VFLAFLTVHRPPKDTLVELKIGEDDEYINAAVGCAASVYFNVMSIEYEDRGLSGRNSWAKVRELVTNPNYFSRECPVTRVYVAWDELDEVTVSVGHGKGYGLLYPDQFLQYDRFEDGAYPRQSILHPLAVARTDTGHV